MQYPLSIWQGATALHPAAREKHGAACVELLVSKVADANPETMMYVFLRQYCLLQSMSLWQCSGNWSFVLHVVVVAGMRKTACTAISVSKASSWSSSTVL